MEDLNDTLCAVIFGITNCSIDSLTQMSNGVFLPHILEKIDPEVFKSDDQSLSKWKTVQDRLEKYLESKGIRDRGLELPIQELEECDYDSIVSSVLQILAIFVTFNKPGWDEVLKTLDFYTRTHITKLLDDMVESLKQLVELSQKMQKFGQDELSLGFLLSKLEIKEEELEKMQAEITKLKETLTKETALRQELKDKLQAKEKEFVDMQDVKEKAYQELIQTYSHSKNEDQADKLAGAIRERDNEINDLKYKLTTAQNANLDRDLEISKLNSLIASLTVSHNQNEDLRKQLEHYEQNIKEIRVQNEYLNSRMNSVSNVDGLIKNLNQKLNVEKDNNLRLEAQVKEAQPLLEKLQKRIDYLEAQKRFSNAQTGSVAEYSDLQSLDLYRTLEFENQQYKKKIEELEETNRTNSKRLFNMQNMEEENQALRTQIDAFLANGDLNVFKRGKSRQEDVAEQLDFSEQLFKTGQLGDRNFVSLDNLPTTDFSADANPRPHTAPSFGDCANVLYTTLMEFYTNELTDQKKFVIPRTERNRDIMKQFLLTDILQGE